MSLSLPGKLLVTPSAKKSGQSSDKKRIRLISYKNKGLFVRMPPADESTLQSANNFAAMTSPEDSFSLDRSSALTPVISVNIGEEGGEVSGLEDNPALITFRHKYNQVKLTLQCNKYRFF